LSLWLYTTFIFRTLTFLNNDLDLDDYDDEEYELHGEPPADRDAETVYAKVGSTRCKNPCYHIFIIKSAAVVLPLNLRVLSMYQHDNIAYIVRLSLPINNNH
jgi:hypothetical protein